MPNSPSLLPGHSRRSAWLTGSALLAALSSCTLPEASSPGAGADPRARPAERLPSPDGGAGQRWLIDVDPLHAAAFEREPGSGQASAPFAVRFSDVRHDLASGHTTVVLELSRHGAQLPGAHLTAQAELPLLTELSAVRPLPRRAGESERWELSFDNPAARDFAVVLDAGAPGAAPLPPWTGEAASAPPAPLGALEAPLGFRLSAASPSPKAWGGYTNTFESYGLGASPSDFVDPRTEGPSYAWMPAVKWSVQSVNGSKQYVHDGLSNKGYLSFRRYKGNAFGPNGQLPAKYYGELTVTPLKSYAYAPTGDQGTQFYYLDPTHYVELLIKPKFFEVWVADGAEPFSSKGWSRVFYSNQSTSANQVRKLAAEINTPQQTITVLLDGKTYTTLKHPMLSQRPHYFALRGTGNVVAHDNLRLEAR